MGLHLCTEAVISGELRCPEPCLDAHPVLWREMNPLRVSTPRKNVKFVRPVFHCTTANCRLHCRRESSVAIGITPEMTIAGLA